MARQVIDLGAGASPPNAPTTETSFTAFDKANANFLELYEGAVPQFVVAAGQTLAVTRAAHQGATIILGGAGATISFSATTQGDGFAIKIINDTGSAWTVPSFTGATNRFDVSGHTKINSGGSGGIETYTRSSTRYAHISGTTE